MRRKLDLLGLVLVNGMWAGQFVAATLAERSLGPLAVTVYPMLVSVLLLAFFLKRERAAAGQHFFRPQLLSRKTLGRFLLLALFGMVVAQLGATAGVYFTLASTASLLTLTIPIFAAILGVVMLRERLTWMRAASFVLALTGAALISHLGTSTLRGLSTRYLLGDLLVLSSCAGSAFYNAYGKKLLQDFSELELLFYSSVIAVLFLLPITVIREGVLPANFHLGWSAAGGLIYLAVFHYTLAMVIFLHILRRLEVTVVAISFYLIPILGTVIAAIGLGQHIGRLELVGGLLVFAGTILVTIYDAGAASKTGAPSAPGVGNVLVRLPEERVER